MELKGTVRYLSFGFLITVLFEREASIDNTTSLGFRIKEAIIPFDCYFLFV